MVSGWNILIIRLTDTHTHWISVGLNTRSCLSNKAQGGVVYGQYTTAKSCSYAQRTVECMDTALTQGALLLL